MSRKLYKVHISTDIMVVGDSEEDAIAVAKVHASSEITVGNTKATLVKDFLGVPKDWGDNIPYCKAGTTQEDRSCSDLAGPIKEEAPNQETKQKAEPITTTTTTTTLPPVVAGRVGRVKQGLASSSDFSRSVT